MSLPYSEKWLTYLRVDRRWVEVFLDNEIRTLEDVKNLSKDDLKEMGLPIGIRNQLWPLIEKIRKKKIAQAGTGAAPEAGIADRMQEELDDDLEEYPPLLVPKAYQPDACHDVIRDLGVEEHDAVVAWCLRRAKSLVGTADAVQRGLTLDEIASLLLFTYHSSSSSTQNLYARLNAALAVRSPELAGWQGFYCHLNRAMLKLDDVEATCVYRACNANLLWRYVADTAIHWNTIISVTTSRDIATKSLSEGCGTVFEIQITKGAKDISVYSCFPEEREVLLSPGFSARVTQISDSSTPFVVSLSQISREFADPIEEDPVTTAFRMACRMHNAQPSKAVQWYAKAASEGHVAAAFNLGLCFKSGHGVQKNAKRAIQHFRTAADAGHSAACYQMGKMYSKGKGGVAKSTPTAFEYYTKAAKGGHPGAAVMLGLMLEEGKGCGQDFVMAAQWFLTAATAGTAFAQYKYAECHRLMHGVAQNMEEAAEWYRQAAMQGNAAAQYQLGQLLEHGRGVPCDPTAAVAWYRRAAEDHHIGALRALAACHARGLGASQSDYKAIHFYRKAAELGDAASQFHMAVAHEKGVGVAKDTPQALRYYDLAASQGHAKATYNLAMCFKEGKGTGKDIARSAHLMRLAAKLGLPAAMFRTAVCYEFGDGFAIHKGEAAFWYIKGAEEGHMLSQFHAGNCFANGVGVEKNIKEAVHWYTLSANQGCVGAQCNLGVCYAHGRGVPRDQEKALYWYRQAAEQNNASAAFNMGWAYEHGEGVEADTRTAVTWYKRAAELGDEDARTSIRRLRQLSTYI